MAEWSQRCSSGRSANEVHVLETRQFSSRQLALKVRAELVSGQTLQVRLYVHENYIDYAYQLFAEDTPLLRWDNKEHFPTLATYPHHFHSLSGHVQVSPLVGRPEHDLPLVIEYITSQTIDPKGFQDL